MSFDNVENLNVNELGLRVAKIIARGLRVNYETLADLAPRVGRLEVLDEGTRRSVEVDLNHAAFLIKTAYFNLVHALEDADE